MAKTNTQSKKKTEPKAKQVIQENTENVTVSDETSVNEGTDVKIDEVEKVDPNNAEAVEAAKPKPVSKGNRRVSKAMQLELEKTKELAKDNEEKYKRLLAEFENARVRNEKESKKMYDIGAKDALDKLLPVVDNFERAIASIPEEDKERGFEQGVDMIYKQFMSTLEAIGVVPMNAEGKNFDPELHNAVIHVEDENYDENIVVEEMQKGYMYKDQVLRHSMVKVAN